MLTIQMTRSELHDFPKRQNHGSWMLSVEISLLKKWHRPVCTRKAGFLISKFWCLDCIIDNISVTICNVLNVVALTSVKTIGWFSLQRLRIRVENINKYSE